MSEEGLLRRHIENLEAEHKATMLQMQKAHELLSEDKLLSDREVTRLRRVVSGLERELRAARGQEPFAADIRELLELWKRVHKKNARTNIESGGDRWERMRTWRKRYSKQEIADAVCGILEPEHEWWPRTLGRKLDVAHILRRQADFEAFRDTGARVRRGEEFPEPETSDLQEDSFRSNGPVVFSAIGSTPITVVLAAAHQGVLEQPRAVIPGVDGDSWAAQCPAHDDPGRSLLIVRQPNGWVGLWCSHGCRTDRVLAMWNMQLPVLWRGAEHDTEAADYQPRRVRPEAVRDLIRVSESPACSQDTRRMIARTLDRWLPRLPRARGADARTGVHSSRQNTTRRAAA